jgi:hypothetical protein
MESTIDFDKDPVLFFISTKSIALTPNSFKVAYCYVHNEIPALTEAVEKEIKQNALTNKKVDEIYERFFGAPQSILDRIGIILDSLKSNLLKFTSKPQSSQQIELTVGLMQKEIGALQEQLKNERMR